MSSQDFEAMDDTQMAEARHQPDEDGERPTFEAVVKILDVNAAIFMFGMILLVGNSLRQRG